MSPVIDQAVEAMGLMNSRRLARVFDGVARHSPEGFAFKRRAEAAGWREAVRGRDEDSRDRAANRPSGTEQRSIPSEACCRF
ncbi:MAG: hypothetical protein QNJ44_07240 [Rhodobacter sp.]|nr:hypothetical protein [Rhodobacter sp.]